MTNLEVKCQKSKLAHPGLIDDHGAYELGYVAGFNEAMDRVHKAAISMVDSSIVLRWLYAIKEWAESEEGRRIYVKPKEQE